MSNGCASPSPLAVTVRILFLSTNSSRLPSGEKLGESPAPTLCGTPPAVATTHTSLGIGPFGELLTLAGVSSSRLWPRVKAIDVVSGDHVVRKWRLHHIVECKSRWMGSRSLRHE